MSCLIYCYTITVFYCLLRILMQRLLSQRKWNHLLFWKIICIFEKEKELYNRSLQRSCVEKKEFCSRTILAGTLYLGETHYYFYHPQNHNTEVTSKNFRSLSYETTVEIREASLIRHLMSICYRISSDTITCQFDSCNLNLGSFTRCHFNCLPFPRFTISTVCNFNFSSYQLMRFSPLFVHVLNYLFLVVFCNICLSANKISDAN